MKGKTHIERAKDDECEKVLDLHRPAFVEPAFSLGALQTRYNNDIIDIICGRERETTLSYIGNMLLVERLHHAVTRTAFMFEPLFSAATAALFNFFRFRFCAC